MQISIHAPVKGATLLYVFFVLVILNFNPRTREGCDTQQVAIAKAIAGISIHAPVKGATIPVKAIDYVEIDISIHAPVKGATASLHDLGNE